jgi:hypothetical protein
VSHWARPASAGYRVPAGAPRVWVVTARACGELNPELRLVVRIFNTRLGERMDTFFTDCAVLSGSSMAAPSFVAGAPRDPLTRQRRRPVRAVTNAARKYLWHELGLAFLALFALLATGFALLLGRHTVGNSVYLMFMDAAGAAFTNPGDGTSEKVAQTMLTLAGLAFIPVATAAVASARLTGSLQGQDRPISDHVIVAGLGNVGTRIVGQLHDLGVGVVCVDKSEGAAGIPLARRLGLRVVIGETHR